MEKASDYNIKLLMNLAKNGSSETFGVIYDKYFMPIYRYIFSAVKRKEIAEDMAQTVFLKAFKLIENYNDNGNDPAPYFFYDRKKYSDRPLKKEKRSSLWRFR